MNNNNIRDILLHPLVWLGAIVIAVLLGAASIFSLGYTSTAQPSGYPTAVLFYVPAPTLTPTGIALPTVEPTPTPRVTLPPIVDSNSLIGNLVQIIGTDGEGLNLRAEPGLGTQILYLGTESEVFEVRDGPVEADDFVWWYLVGLQDETRNGWGAVEFLEVIQSP